MANLRNLQKFDREIKEVWNMLTRLDTRVALGKDVWSAEQRGQFGDLYDTVSQLAVAVSELVDANR